MPPLKKAKLSATAEEVAGGQGHRRWWSPASAIPAWSMGTTNELQEDLDRYPLSSEKLLHLTYLLPCVCPSLPDR